MPGLGSCPGARPVTNKVSFYVCGLDLTALDKTDVVVYPSIDDLKEDIDCWEEHGIAKITVDLETVEHVHKPGMIQ